MYIHHIDEGQTNGLLTTKTDTC